MPIPTLSRSLVERPVWHALRVSGVALLALMAWEVAGADRWVSAWFADPVQGFAWRAHPWLVKVFHEGGRMLAGLVFAGLLVDAFLRRGAELPSRAKRVATLALIVACMALVSLFKRGSLSSCPWDVLDFGGTVAYVPHWPWLPADGGPGHCFPSGHASAAFAFFPLYFLWRPYAPRAARGVLATVVCFGLVFGVTQVVRGAHYVSHVAWTAWICWTISALALSRYDVVHSRRHHGRSPDIRPQEQRAARA
jgi:membrane-associated PAP2 superfamily phosphatase